MCTSLSLHPRPCEPHLVIPLRVIPRHQSSNRGRRNGRGGGGRAQVPSHSRSDNRRWSSELSNARAQCVGGALRRNGSGEPTGGNDTRGGRTGDAAGFGGDTVAGEVAGGATLGGGGGGNARLLERGLVFEAGKEAWWEGVHTAHEGTAAATREHWN
jgi:hypothetical protein